jgi:DNA-binding NarL/FixJ family response regulator
VTADLERQLATRRAEVEALTERLVMARGRLSATMARNREIRAHTTHPRTDSLQEAIRSRDVIGQAKGILMAGGLSEEEAFNVLRRASQRAHRKLAVIAEEFVRRTAKTAPDWADGEDPLADARRAAAEMDGHRAALALLADQRAEAVRRALAGGLSRSDVARSLGVTRQAITKLLADHGPV